MTHVTQILCPTDYSKPSGDAIRYAAAMAKVFNAHLTVFHVMGPGEELPSPEHDSHFEQLSDSEAIHCDHVYRDGDPAEEIIKIVGELSIDHVVMGTYGRDGFHCVEMGDTVEKVVHGVPCAVTVVHNEDIPSTTGT